MGVISIGKRKLNWHRIKAEYVTGTSQKKLAEKYHVSRDSIARHSRMEGWTEERNKAKAEITQNVIQKTANAEAENAVIAARIKAKLLRKLEKEIDALPDAIGSETRNSLTEKSGGKDRSVLKEVTKAYKFRDLTLAYKDLTDDMNLNASEEQVRIIIDV